MSFTLRAPIAPGTLYAVVDVAGHPPVSIMDFVGNVEFHVMADGARHRVVGTGVPGSTVVLRFDQIVEDPGGGPGQELRIWDVSAVPGAGVVAYQVDGP